jgi:hypothetical protein
LMSSLNRGSSPTESVLRERSSRFCSLAVEADLEDFRSSVEARSRRCVRKDDCERKK